MRTGGPLAIVEALVKKGANVNAKNDCGNTALHGAVKGRREVVVKLLVEEGAHVNAKKNRGDTPLHMAALFGKKEVAHRLLEHGAFALIANNERLTPLDYAIKPYEGEPDVALIRRMLLPSGALVHLAKNAAEAHEKRRKRVVKGLKRAVESPGFLEDLADTLAGIGASGCAPGTGASLSALLRQLDAFAKGADGGTGKQAAFRAPERRRLGEAYEERRRRHSLAVARAVQMSEFLSDLAEGLAGVNMYESDPVAPKELVAAARRLDALALEERQRRISPGLQRAAQSPGFLSHLAVALAGVDSTGCVPGTGAMLVALLRQLDAFARADADGPGEGGP
ncbi:MAG: ankyrin repeat domain-containing protein, partial [Planctomycetota bacterium]|nr:ankyrin repeat domain-containing protein [Planctomycetota bacterium]